MGSTKQYGFLSNAAFSLKLNWKAGRYACVWGVIGTAAKIAAPFSAILMPKLVIDGITNGVSANEFITSVGLGALAFVFLVWLNSYADFVIEHEFGMLGTGAFGPMNTDKKFDCDFELLTDPDAKKISDKAERATMNNHTPACTYPKHLAELAANVGGFILYGAVITRAHWGMLPLIALSAVVTTLMLNRATSYEQKKREDIAVVRRKAWYAIGAFKERDLAKDLRVYSLKGFLNRKKDQYIAEYLGEMDHVNRRNMHAALTGAAMVVLRDGAAYALLVYLLINGRVGLGDFTLMFAAVGAFAGWLQGVILSANELRRANTEITDVRAFFDMPDRMNRSEGDPVPRHGAPTIELRGVGYTYPGADKPALEDVNISIKAGERLAVVGVNGAGKSTLVNLICGLFKPTVGAITMNGIDISRFNRDEYYTAFSAVFQRIALLPDTVACNVSQTTADKTDRERVKKCLEMAGLWEKIASLPNGMDTEKVKQVEPDAIDLSGGENQKLALARAIYRESPVIVLDEPTAALDPIAESAMYERYAELTEGRTSVYISHRLASTRFCDRIILLDGRRVSEEGNHDELMTLGGKYAEMFNVQASYYKEGYNENGEEAAV